MSVEEHTDNATNSWSLEDAIIQLENVASITAKQRHTNVSELAKAIADHAYDSGIPTLLLERLIGIIAKSKHLDQTTITTLIKNLYPAERVPTSIVARVVCCFGPTKTKPSPATQSLLLRWLILVYEDMEDRLYLSRLYSVLFDLLDMISLRRALCHLLSLITRRVHIKPFRIQALMELMRNTGDDERELAGLLRVFKSYYPDIIVGEAHLTGRRATYFFKHPDPDWVKHMREIHDKVAGLQGRAPQTFQVVRRGGFKRSRVEVVIPEVQTSRVRHNFTSLEELRNVRDFVQKFDKIQLPNQIASSLADPLAQKYLLLVQNEEANQRLESWLGSFFGDELDNLLAEDGLAGVEEGNTQLGYVLETALNFVRFTKTLPIAVDEFLRACIPLWDGLAYRGTILGLLEYVPVRSYRELYDKYFKPLEAAILDCKIESKVAMLRYYSSLIRRWGSVARSTQSELTSPPLMEVIRRAELLSLAILENQLIIQNGGDLETSSTSLSVLQFYTTLADLFSHAPTNSNIRITVPLAQTVYLLAFTPSSGHVSLLSSALAIYKSSFESSLSSTARQNPQTSEPLYPTAMVAQFNGYVMDICNLIWRNRGLNTEDPNAQGCLIPADTVKALADYLQELNENQPDSASHKYQVPTIFSLSQNVALAGISAACFRAIEDDSRKEGRFLSVKLTKPVTQKALALLDANGGVKMNWQDYRLKMLDWLDEHGVVGIGELMRSTMKALRK